jgi:hypothetical protein
MPTLADFSCCYSKARSAKLAIFLLHIELLQPPYETGIPSIKKGKGQDHIWIDPRASGRYWRGESRNQKTASIDTSPLLKKD